MPRQQPITARDFTGSNLWHIIIVLNLDIVLVTSFERIFLSPERESEEKCEKLVKCMTYSLEPLFLLSRCQMFRPRKHACCARVYIFVSHALLYVCSRGTVCCFPVHRHSYLLSLLTRKHNPGKTK